MQSNTTEAMVQTNNKKRKGVNNNASLGLNGGVTSPGQRIVSSKYQSPNGSSGSGVGRKMRAKSKGG